MKQVRERGGVLLSHFTLDQSTEGDLQQFFDSTKGTCAQSFCFFSIGILGRVKFAHV